MDEKEQELLNKLNELEKYKKKELELQIEELKFGIESIIGSCQMIENSISLSNNNDKNDARLLAMKNLYQSRLNYLSTNIWRIEPCYNSFIEFLMSEDEEESIYSISYIGTIDSNQVSVEKCTILNEKQIVYENEEFKFEIISYSKEGNEMRKGGNGKKFQIQIERETENGENDENNENDENDENENENDETNEDSEWEITDLNDGRYEVKLKLINEGKYLIFIEYDGMYLPSSPFQIEVFETLNQRNYNEINEPKLTFGSQGNENGQFVEPFGLAIDSKGNILVCERENNRIQIFNPEGKFISTFGSKGNGNGQFNGPSGITINSKGNIIICDQDNHKIQIFSAERKFVSTFGSYGNENGQFNSPDGICIDLNDNIYICDYGNNRIQIFDPEGKFLLTFGSEGNENGQFGGPCGVAVNSKGNIIVCEHSNCRIQIFDSERNFISTFGSKGNGNGQFGNIFQMCIDLNDNILVCDCSDGIIHIFGPNGKYITQFKVDQPTGIVADPNSKNVIVCGSDNKVSIFWIESDNKVSILKKAERKIFVRNLLDYDWEFDDVKFKLNCSIYRKNHIKNSISNLWKKSINVKLTHDWLEKFKKF